MSDETLPTCDCGNVWGSHPPDCPVSRQFDHLRVENKALKERKAEYHRLWNVAEARCDRLEAALRDSLHMPVGSDASISAMGLHREFSAALAGTTEPTKASNARSAQWLAEIKAECSHWDQPINRLEALSPTEGASAQCETLKALLRTVIHWHTDAGVDSYDGHEETAWLVEARAAVGASGCRL